MLEGMFPPPNLGPSLACGAEMEALWEGGCLQGRCVSAGGWGEPGAGVLCECWERWGEPGAGALCECWGGGGRARVPQKPRVSSARVHQPGFPSPLGWEKLPLPSVYTCSKPSARTYLPTKNTIGAGRLRFFYSCLVECLGKGNGTKPP